LHTVSQTKKGKFERWDNVQEAFEISAELPEEIQHIAIVDDVITTGSTLETIIRLFHEQKELKISIISIAYAGN
jgi:predicted amidophosphoribosyltransferase